MPKRFKKMWGRRPEKNAFDLFPRSPNKAGTVRSRSDSAKNGFTAAIGDAIIGVFDLSAASDRLSRAQT
ncbi:hypothetical protein STSP2_00760 [Anaerohalosphaera lusitana]|uniref:Uncharacterized protein n=1 Tax=Anaerohalosphaera lusitana TaxID=1936003 RepID=A0A1U9NI47_9BACT|nr:hypothetical protein STSP2_00760 [Anaerohalosphaera lusitana]